MGGACSCPITSATSKELSLFRRQIAERSARALDECGQLGIAAANAVDDGAGSLGEERLVGELAVAVLLLFLQLREFFAESLTLGPRVDGLFVDDGDIEGGSGAVCQTLRQLRDDFKRRDAREALDGREVLLEDRGVRGAEKDGDGFTLGYAGVFSG